MKNTFDLFPCRDNLKKLLTLCPTIALLSWKTFAAIPAPEKLLPDDTLVVITAPDFAKLRDVYASCPQTQLWSDPAMKPFKDKFMSKLREEFFQPLERELGVSLDDYAKLPQGQLTF